MPLIDVQVILKPGETLANNFASKIADTIGQTMDSPPGHVWVKVTSVSRSSYAENGSTIPDKMAPIFISVLLGELPETAQLEQLSANMAAAVAAVSKRKKSEVHIVFEPAGVGRVSFAGNLMT